MFLRAAARLGLGFRIPTKHSALSRGVRAASGGPARRLRVAAPVFWGAACGIGALAAWGASDERSNADCSRSNILVEMEKRFVVIAAPGMEDFARRLVAAAPDRFE